MIVLLYVLLQLNIADRSYNLYVFLSGHLRCLLWRPLRRYSVTHHTSHITHHTSHITHHTSHITHHTSHITGTHHTSHITHHTSHITHHTSHITPHLTHSSALQQRLLTISREEALSAKTQLQITAATLAAAECRILEQNDAAAAANNAAAAAAASAAAESARLKIAFDSAVEEACSLEQQLDAEHTLNVKLRQQLEDTQKQQQQQQEQLQQYIAVIEELTGQISQKQEQHLQHHHQQQQINSKCDHIRQQSFTRCHRIINIAEKRRTNLLSRYFFSLWARQCAFKRQYGVLKHATTATHCALRSRCCSFFFCRCDILNIITGFW
jgi:hypothetical protein